jgi:hypothetical protein
MEVDRENGIGEWLRGMGNGVRPVGTAMEPGDAGGQLAARVATLMALVFVFVGAVLFFFCRSCRASLV